MSFLHKDAAELFTSRHCNHVFLTFAGHNLPADVWRKASSCLLFPVGVPSVDRAVRNTDSLSSMVPSLLNALRPLATSLLACPAFFVYSA